MYSVSFATAESVDDAVSRLKNDPDAKLISGGMTLLPTMKFRLANPSELVDLLPIMGLSGISIESDKVSIGATARHTDVANHSALITSLPALAKLAGGIGDAQVRNRGTIGGSVANNDPAADYPAALLALGATVRTDRREISAESFFVDMFETALADDEVITAVDFPIPDYANYVKFPNPASRYAIVGVFVAKFGENVRVAITGAAPCVCRFSDAEKALTQHFHADALNDLSYPADDLNEDLHASAVYRAHLIPVLAKRAVTGDGPPKL